VLGELAGILVFGVDGRGTDANEVGGLDRPP
jgi:hypothetical protein